VDSWEDGSGDFSSYREQVNVVDAAAALAALKDPARRSLFEFVRRAGRPVTREEAAEGVGISRKLAAFHLDRLVEASILESGYRPGGIPRRVGRTPKVYEARPEGVHISIPGRQYQALADVLLDALVDEASTGHAREAALRAAHARGLRLGHSEQGRFEARGSPDPSGWVLELVERLGFEPQAEAAAVVRLRNCPFHPLCARAPDLVCRLNHQYLAGLVTGLGTAALHPVLAPRPGECCVELRGDGA
jgi:predicted ArsR family transcriptional regulator